jgi:hypothetical protein
MRFSHGDLSALPPLSFDLQHSTIPDSLFVDGDCGQP